MKLTLEAVKELVRLVDASDVSLLEVEAHGVRLTVRKATEDSVAQPSTVTSLPETAGEARKPILAVTPPGGAAASEEDGYAIKAPMVGTFYRAPSPGVDPYVQEGAEVQKTTVVCIVEAMKLMNEIEAEVEGTILEILVEDGQLVDYGQPLMRVRRNSGK